MARQFQASEVLSECLQPPPPPPPTYALNTAVRLQGVAGHKSAGRHRDTNLAGFFLLSVRRTLVVFVFVFGVFTAAAGQTVIWLLSKIITQQVNPTAVTQ